MSSMICITTNTDPGPSGAGDAGIGHADLVGNTVPILNPSKPQQLMNPNNSNSVSVGNYWFNPANFSVARINALDNLTSDGDTSGITSFYPYGTFPRNGIRGPGQINLDLSISKHFIIREKSISNSAATLSTS